MFDLFRSREKAVRIVLGGIIVVIGLSMVTYLIPGGVGGDRSQDQVIAEIGKKAVTIPDFQQRLEFEQRQGKVPPSAAAAFAQQLLDRIISNEAVAYEAQRMGIVVTDADLAKAVRATVPQLFPNGQFAGRDAYAGFIAQQFSLTVPEFESQMRRELLVTRLSGIVVDNVVVTPDDAVREYQRRERKTKLQYIAVDQAAVKDKVNVTPAQIRSYFDSTRAQYRIPEKRAFQLLVVDAAQVAQKISIPDDQLRKIYDQNKDAYRVPERVHVRHILLKTTDKPAAEVARAQAKAEDLLKQLKAGANFADLARKDSEDPGSAVKGGDLGWIVRDQTVKAFENAAFSLKPNELSGVIKTEYGFHILQVLERQDARVKPFEEVKDQIAAERKKQQVYDTMQQLADQAHDELVKHPQQGTEIASRLGIDQASLSNVSPGQAVPVFGANPDFSDAIASLAAGGVTPVMQAPGDRLAVAVVTGITPARPAELSEVENQIRAFLTGVDAGDMVRNTANEVRNKAAAPGADFAKIAQQAGLEVKTTQDFGPDGSADGIGPATVLQAAFDQPVGSVFGPVGFGGKQFVCKIVERNAADMSKFDAAKADIEASLKEQKSREQFELFVDSVRSALIRDGKIKIHQQVYDRMLAAGRG